MKLISEQYQKIKEAKSVEEVITLAKENGITLSEEKAKFYFEQAHKAQALEDEELDNVSGGCGGSSKPNPKYKVGQEVLKVYAYSLDRGQIIAVADYDSDNGYLYKVHMENGDEFFVFLETRTDYVVR